MTEPKRKPCAKKQRGLTLIELAIGLTIVLAVTALVIGVSVATTRSQRTNDIQTQITSIVSALRSISVGGSYAGISADALARSGKLPQAWIADVDSEKVIRTPFAGDYVIRPGSDAGADDAAFALDVPGLPVSACVDIATVMQRGFLGVNTTSEQIKPLGGANAEADDIISKCASDGADDGIATLTLIGN